MERENSFTTGPILGPLVRFALPVLLALFLQALYGAIDLWVVGKFAEAADVSGVSTGSQITQTVAIVITGLAMGITVQVGQKIGEGRPDEAGRAIGSGITLFLLLALAVTAVMVPGAGAVSRLMQAPAEALGETTAYVRLCGAGTVFIVAYNVLGSIFRGIGDSKMPLYTVAIASVFNVAGDLFFVAVLFGLLLVLFFISYFIIKLIFKSQNIYFSTVRMLGGTQGSCSSVLLVELLVIFHIAFAAVAGFVYKVMDGTITRFPFLTQLTLFIEKRDFLILYGIVLVLTLLLARRYSKQMFRKTAMNAYKEEV